MPISAYWTIFLEEVVMMKWRVLLLSCCITFGSYYIYDFPGTLGTGAEDDPTIEKRFKDNGKVYDEKMNQALYSVYSWPNVILAFMWGIVMDKYLGLRNSVQLGTGFIFIGASLFYIGVVTTQYWLLICGRFAFGLGGESLTVGQGAIVSRWFKTGRPLLALAMGITFTFLRCASALSFFLSPILATKQGVSAAALAGVFATGLSFLACFALRWADRRGERNGLVPPETKDLNSEIGIKKLILLPPSLWLLSTVMLFLYASIFPFIGIAINYFEVKYGISRTAASQYISLYQVISAILCPIVGFVVDRTGRFNLWMIAAGVGFATTYVLFLLTPVPIGVMMVWIAMTYACLASSWSAIPFAVNPTAVGIGFGVVTAMENFGLAVFPIGVGAILDEYPGRQPNNTRLVNTTNGTETTMGADEDTLPSMKGFHVVMFLMFTAIAISMMALFVLVAVDKVRRKGILSASPTKRKLIEAMLYGTEDLADEGIAELCQEAERSGSGSGAVARSSLVQEHGEELDMQKRHHHVEQMVPPDSHN